MAGFQARWITGKTVARVEMNPFPADDGTGCRLGMAFAPRIYFTDGSSIAFGTQETEVGEYGTDIGYRKASK